MATFIEKSRIVGDILKEIEVVDRICDITYKLDAPIMNVDNDEKRYITSDLYVDIRRCLNRYKEILLETELHK